MKNHLCAHKRPGLGAFCLLFVLSLFAPAPAAAAGEEKEAAKAILGRCQEAVIGVKAVVKLRVAMGGSEQMKEENETETLATVVDPSGLAVLSFSSIDPARAFEGILKKLGASKDGPQVSVDSDVTGVTMVMPDGREIPAKLVFRDADLDLAFVRPSEKQDKPFAAIELTGQSKPDLLDTVLVLSRLDKAAGRAPSVSLLRVEAVIASPRKYYIADGNALIEKLGAPVFSLDGKVVGFSLLRISKTADKSAGFSSFLFNKSNSLGIMPVILPAGDVLAAAKQAAESKKE